MNTQKTFLTDDQVAERLGVKVSTIRGWRYQGKGPQYMRLSHKCVRYDPDEVKAWEEEHTYSSTAEEAAERA